MRTITARIVATLSAIAALAGCGSVQQQAVPVSMTIERINIATLKVTAWFPPQVTDPVWFALDPAQGVVKTASLSAIAVVPDPADGSAVTYVQDAQAGPKSNYKVSVSSTVPGVTTPGPVYAGYADINTLYPPLY